MRRYPGIRSFEASESGLFFGRKREIHELHDMIKARRFVVLFSKSGIGKSSLLQAGVLPRLQQEQYCPIKVRFQGKNTIPEKALRTTIEQYATEQGLTQTVQTNLQQFLGNREPNLWEYFKAVSLSQDKQKARPILILDQFEEFFSCDKNACLPVVELLCDWLMERVPEQVEDICANTPRSNRTELHKTWVLPLDWKLVIAIRSDKLSYLNALSSDIPIIYNNRYQLLPLQKENAKEAILAPAALAGDFDSPVFQYESTAINSILTHLSSKKKEEIEPFQLQLLCQHLEQQVIDAKLNTITEKEIGGEAGIQEILNNYYERSINTLPQNQQLSARQLIEQGLIIDDARVSLAEATIKSHYKIDDTLLSALLNTRLIRAENTHLGKAYEIAHDTLVAPITESFTQRDIKETAQKRKAAIQRSRRAVIAFLCIAFVLFAATAWAVVNTLNAREQWTLNERIINEIYFYKGRYGLTMRKDTAEQYRYGFMDKQGNEHPHLPYIFEEARPFDDYGFARVKKAGQLFLVDTFGRFYPLAECVTAITPETQAVSLREQSLEELPLPVLQNAQLRVLHLRGNNLKSLPPLSASLPQLRVLDIAQNQLMALPSDINKIASLRVLDASDNKINNLQNLSDMDSLQLLFLNKNQLTTLPDSLATLYNLEVLELSGNGISVLNERLLELEKLRILNVYQNPLTGIPAAFSNKKSLEVVVTTGKTISTTPTVTTTPTANSNTTITTDTATVTNNTSSTPTITTNNSSINNSTIATPNSTTTNENKTAGSLVTAESLGIKMIYVEGGNFEMGSNDGESDEKPMHTATLSSFYMGETEITQKQYETVIGNNPSHFENCPDCPVEQVSWYDAVRFCNALSKKESITPFYTIDGVNIQCDWNSSGYRLPTEAEWEYAAKGGNKSKGYQYSGSNNLSEVAWYGNSLTGKVQPVKTKKSNELGLYDMSGNLYEWCWDWYNKIYYEKLEKNNPKGANYGSSKVLRGGAWYGYDTEALRIANRYSDAPNSNESISIGFRIVRNATK